MSKKVIAIILTAAMLILSLSACGGKKEALSAADFKTKAEAAGLTVTDASSTYTDAIFTSAQAAKSPDGWYIIYLDVDTVENAQAYYYTCKTYMEGQKTGAGSAQTTDHDDYKMYSQSSGGRFMYCAQIADTFIYVDEDDANKDAIKSVIKNLGY